MLYSYYIRKKINKAVKIKQTKDYPCTLRSSAGKLLKDYKIYGNSNAYLPVKYLPAEYQQVEYITNNSTGYFDTNFIPTENSKFEIKFYSPFDKCNEVFFGSRTSNTFTTSYDQIYFNNSTTIPLFFVGKKNNNAVKKIIETSKFNILNFDIKNLIATNVKTGKSINLISTFDNNSAQNIYLLALNDKGDSVKAICKNTCKLYYFKIWEDDVLVRNMIPCYRKSDNEIGMYDTVNGVFYTNQGSGTFSKGEDITSLISVGDLLLPDEYQEVEYITNTYAQYIDTNYYANQTTEIKIKYCTHADSKTGFLFGARKSTTSAEQFIVYLASTSGHGHSFRADGLSAIDTVGKTFTGSIYENYYSCKHYTINRNGTNIEDKDITGAEDFTGEYPIYLFGSNLAGSCNSNMICRIYYVKIYDNKKLVRNMIPCYRKSDNEIGMYDTVNGVFYSNQGSGTFSKGDDVNNYKIPIKINDNLVDVITLSEPLKKVDDYVDYIDFRNKKIVRNVQLNDDEILSGLSTPTEETISLSKIPTEKGTNTITTDTTVEPFNIYCKYVKR